MRIYGDQSFREMERGLELVSERLGLDGVDAEVQVRRGERLRVRGGAGSYVVEYGGGSELFRALALLSGSLRIGETELDICEEKRFDTCGVMIDCSRNAVLKPDKVKEVLVKMACIGLNRLMLYLEDTYQLEEYPYFGYMRGAYTPEEIREIDQTARSLGIELVPCIQTLAHLKMALRWPYADQMRDTAEVLMVGQEETYRLIDAMFRAVRETYSTRTIHIGMDEAAGLGLGAYLEKNGYRNRFEILSEHLRRVMELARKHGLEPMIWSDMFFRLGSETGEYYELEPNFPENLEQMIPKGLSLVYWDYYHTDRQTYDAMLKNHQKLGRRVVFAGGIWLWCGMGVLYDHTFETTRAGLEACRDAGIRDVFATMWGDDGAENNIDNAWLGMQLYGEYQYYDYVGREHLKKRFQQCLGYDMDAFLSLQVDDYPEAWKHDQVAGVSKEVLYQDVLCGMFDKNFEGIDLRARYQAGLARLERSEAPEELKLLFDYQKQLRRVLISKCDIGLRIRESYRQRESMEQYVTELEALAREISSLHGCFTLLWESSNKNFGLDRIDLRFGGLLMRIQTAERRIREYTAGVYPTIPELEEEKLMFGGDAVNPGKSLVHLQVYDRISSASSKSD